MAAHRDLDVDTGMQDVVSTGAENSTDVIKQKPRRQPCCGFCRNHNLEVPVINHQCPHADCSCVFCELARRRRKIMRHQQRLWRFKKFDAWRNEIEQNAAEGEVTPSKKQREADEQLLLADSSKFPTRRKMVCDKCRNHDAIVKKRGHKGSCPYEQCTCVLCTFTIKRQQLMKHQQRVRRSQIAAPSEPHKERSLTQPPTHVDSPTSDPQPPKEASRTSPPLRDNCEERQEDGSESTSSPVLLAPPDAPPTEELKNAVKECSKVDNASQPQDLHSVNTFPQPPPPPHPAPPQPAPPLTLEPLQEYHKTVQVHSSLSFSKSEQNINSLPGIECPDNMIRSVRYSSFQPHSQISATPAPMPTISRYGLDVGHQSFLPWYEMVSGTSGRCMVGCNNNYPRPQAPLRPQPIPAARLSRSPMDWQFIGFPYPPASMLQSVPQSTLSVCDNFRIHYPQVGMDDHWQGTRGRNPAESSGVHSHYSGGLPYFASALLHPSAKPSFSLMPESKTLPEYGPSLSVFRQREQHQDNLFGAYTRHTSNNDI